MDYEKRKKDMLKKAITDYKKYLKLTLTTDKDKEKMPGLVLSWMDSEKFAPKFLD